MKAFEDDGRQRLEQLITRSAVQRRDIASIGIQLQKNLRWVDFGFAAGRVLRAHPLLAMAGAAQLVRLPGGSRLRWLGRVFTAWELFNIVRKERKL